MIDSIPAVFWTVDDCGLRPEGYIVEIMLLPVSKEIEVERPVPDRGDANCGEEPMREVIGRDCP